MNVQLSSLKHSNHGKNIYSIIDSGYCSSKGRPNLILAQKRIPHRKNTSVESIYLTKTQTLAYIVNQNHCHVLVLGLTQIYPCQNWTGEFKANSSRWINEQKWILENWKWARWFLVAFSYSKSQLIQWSIQSWIKKERHRKITFQEEYLQLLADIRSLILMRNTFLKYYEIENVKGNRPYERARFERPHLSLSKIFAPMELNYYKKKTSANK